ncbi:DUF3307 domain-containing protein [Winogradskyella echinorum]|uniref:DUF3307 domain-containing protein n=1 Tax=Winogradskyella echinorum TaxID=538189 RepID=A0ABR6Y2Z2_9FLAO|nr:DUF3307 domain-containing protein [Winogradskyella echinorum]MBC3847120.1 DUF3307 domain-containing protein [Winogradskyella echinorum]MBC5751468.1 DUF3307 domain-containing protein [Winogradskyella echinorum]
MTALLLKLILAHLIGDFFLQPQKWVKDKEKKKLKSIWLYVHVTIHIALMFLIVWDLSYTLLIISIGALHLIIDALKLTLQKKKTKRFYFFIDQLMHFITLIVLALLFFKGDIEFTFTLNTHFLLLLISIGFLTTPTSIIMKTIFSKWNISKLTKNNESLKDAGKYIGVLERLLVFIFIATSHWEAVGFLITAKSVFRFGDLTASKERKLTEYILIGTLISFGIAILISLIYLYLRNYV